MATIAANGTKLEYEAWGEGEPFLFIMGLGGQLIDWPDGLLQHFVDAGYQVIRFDNRDSGLSEQSSWRPPKAFHLARNALSPRPLQGVPYNVATMAGDAAGLLRALGHDAAHVVGMSMGGMIAQELAIGYPSLVRSLGSIMSNTGDRRSGRIKPELLARFARRGTPTRATAVEDAIRVMEAIAGPEFDLPTCRLQAERQVERSFTPAGTARQLAAIAGSPDRTERLGGVAAPTLVIHGLLDRMVDPSGGVATAKAIPQSRLLMFPEMAHSLPPSLWPEIASALIANAQRSPAKVDSVHA